MMLALTSACCYLLYVENGLKIYLLSLLFFVLVGWRFISISINHYLVHNWKVMKLELYVYYGVTHF